MIAQPEPRPWRSLYLDFARHIGRGVLAGMLCGFVIGGVGGRLAMFILRLTSDPSVRGLESDDGFTIGAFTADTLFLLIAATLVGGFGGLVYLVVREWLSQPWRATVAAGLAGAVGGAFAIRPDGVDFTELEPVPLAVAMFIALPALYGAAVSLLADHAVEAAWGRGAGAVIFLPALVLLTALPIAAAAAVVLLALAFDRRGAVSAVWRSRSVTWAGRLALVVALAFATRALVQDVTAVL